MTAKEMNNYLIEEAKTRRQTRIEQGIRFVPPAPPKVVKPPKVVNPLKDFKLNKVKITKVESPEPFFAPVDIRIKGKQPKAKIIIKTPKQIDPNPYFIPCN